MAWRRQPLLQQRLLEIMTRTNSSTYFSSHKKWKHEKPKKCYSEEDRKRTEQHCTEQSSPPLLLFTPFPPLLGSYQNCVYTFGASIAVDQIGGCAPFEAVYMHLLVLYPRGRVGLHCYHPSLNLVGNVLCGFLYVLIWRNGQCMYVTGPRSNRRMTFSADLRVSWHGKWHAFPHAFQLRRNEEKRATLRAEWRVRQAMRESICPNF